MNEEAQKIIDQSLTNYQYILLALLVVLFLYLLIKEGIKRLGNRG